MFSLLYPEDLNTSTEKTKSDLFDLLECLICKKVVKDTNICPKCCQHFCNACILKWLNGTSKTCPKCRVALSAHELLKCPAMDDLRDAIRQVRQPDRCKQHEMHELSMFCYPCETCICPSCSCSEQHVEHKERIVPLETVFEHYKKTLGQDLDWMSERRAEVSEALDQSEKNEKLLMEVKEHIIGLHDQTTRLIAGKPNVQTIQEMLRTEKTIAETRSQSKARKLLPSDCTEFFVPEPSKFVFHFPEFDKIFESSNIHRADVTFCGFTWSCKVEKDGIDYYCSLRLVEGKPSKYGVCLADFTEEFVHFDSQKEFTLGILVRSDFAVDDDDVEGGAGEDTLALTVFVRQSYADRLEQLQEYNEQLEEEKAKNDASWKSLRQWWKEQGPSSA